MPQPQRPFVPHPTPTRPPQTGGRTEFRLSRPFVPGSEQPAAMAPETTDDIARESSGGLPGIEEFLQVEMVASAVAPAQDPYEEFEEPDELPPVEHFLDPLPPVSSFADEFPSNFDAGAGGSGGGVEPLGTNEEGWLEDAWQNYDWKAAASLGETAEAEASNAWAETDWGSMSLRANASRPTAAQAIASALDEIARRIRDGELVVPPSATGVVPDPTSIAATLASLLGIRK